MLSARNGKLENDMCVRERVEEREIGRHNIARVERRGFRFSCDELYL